MNKIASASIPSISLSSLSAGKFMLRPAGPRKDVWYHPHRDDYYMFGVMLTGSQTISVDFQDIRSLYEILLRRINRENEVELTIASAKLYDYVCAIIEEIVADISLARNRYVS